MGYGNTAMIYKVQDITTLKGCIYPLNCEQ